MNERTALQMLSRVMQWGDERSRDEFRWLRLISMVKYDSYRDFLAGVRFLESLVGWLLQFKPIDREAAYDFVRHRLVFISALERERLIEIMYPRTVLPRLLERVAHRHEIAPWQVYTNSTALSDLKVERRRTLFLGLSDGARLDTFRHANVGRISNEQVVAGTQLHSDKWAELHRKLEKDLRAMGSAAPATFATIYLVDDFAGSGTSFLREEQNEKTGAMEWTGKLLRFMRAFEGQAVPYAEDWMLVVHHLIITKKAEDHLNRSIVKFAMDRPVQSHWFSDFVVSHTYAFDEVFPLDPSNPQDAAFCQLSKVYYDPAIVTTAHLTGGEANMGMGYAGCALPLVLDHNTPNNSVALLWADSSGKNGAHPMRPLFFRRDRHAG